MRFGFFKSNTVTDSSDESSLNSSDYGVSNFLDQSTQFQGVDAPTFGSSSTVMAAAATAPAPTLVTSAGSNLEFNLIWDSSVASAPSGFESAWISAATFIEKNLTTLGASPIVFNLHVGYGEVAGQTIPFGALSASSTEGDYVSYDTLASALRSVYGASTYSEVYNATIAGTDPTGQASGSKEFFVPYAEEMALGLRIGTSGYQTAIEGWVGMAKNSFFTKLDYTSDASLTKTGKMPSSSTYDAVAAAAHEITEVMGRISGLGTSLQPGTGATWTALDLFRYSGSNTPALSSKTGYFSVDHGATNLGTYNSSTGDAGDWASSAYDSFGFAHKGYYSPVSSTDVLETAMLGYTLTPTAVNNLNSHPPTLVA